MNAYIKKGFRGLVDVNALMSLVDTDYFGVSASITLGSQVNKHLFVGGGISPTFIGGEEFLLPFYSAVRYDFKNAKNSFFLDARLGFSLSITGYDDSGFYAYLGGGFRLNKWSIRTGFSLYYPDDVTYGIGIGYEF